MRMLLLLRRVEMENKGYEAVSRMHSGGKNGRPASFASLFVRFINGPGVLEKCMISSIQGQKLAFDKGRFFRPSVSKTAHPHS